MIVAQGKAAEAAALGKPRPNPLSLFSNLIWRAEARQTRLEKREAIILCLLPRAAHLPRLPWATILSSLQDFSLTRSARILGEL